MEGPHPNKRAEGTQEGPGIGEIPGPINQAFRRLGRGEIFLEALSIQRPAAVSQRTSGAGHIFRDDPTLCLLGGCKTRGRGMQVSLRLESSPHKPPCFTWEGAEHWLLSDPRPTGFPHWPRHGGHELGPSDLEGHQDALCGPHFRPGGRDWREGGRWGFWPLSLRVSAPNSCQEHTPCLPPPHSSRKRKWPSPSLVLGSSPPRARPARPPFPSRHWDAESPQLAQRHALSNSIATRASWAGSASSRAPSWATRRATWSSARRRQCLSQAFSTLAALPCCAFLNSEGGSLLVGVDNGWCRRRPATAYRDREDASHPAGGLRPAGLQAPGLPQHLQAHLHPRGQHLHHRHAPSGEPYPRLPRSC